MIDPFVFRARDLRARGVRRLLRGLVGDPGAAHAADVGHQRDISSVIVVGALLSVGVAGVNAGSGFAKFVGFLALILASVNIFGGFLVTERMLAMYKKKG